MYYPYFRGKQFELILLRDNAIFLKNNNIHPVIEPVREDFTALKRTLKSLNEHSVEYTLIVNPQTGQIPVKQSNILNEFCSITRFDDNMSIGYLLGAESKTDDMFELLKTYNEYPFSILHAGYTDGKKLSDELVNFTNIKNHFFIDSGKLYRKHFKINGINRILIKDGFTSHKKNADYPISEHFSDLHATYEEDGMNGFGDYLIVGSDYSESGGPAYAVAIHLTYISDDGDMFIYHFVSDQTDSPTNPGGKFLEALQKLYNEVNKSDTKIFKSSACQEYLQLYEKQHYPGLGYVKKLSMQHHIELIADYQENQR